MSISHRLPVGEDTDVHRGARRGSRRFSLHADIEVLQPVHATGVVINVSAGGMRAALDREMAIGDRCVARLTSADGQDTMEQARVVWNRRLPDGWLVGLQFE